jgi:hypothetical protein
MNTTLIEELENAAVSLECAAEYLGGRNNRGVFVESAARLRQRAAWVRELERDWLAQAQTGSVPAATALLALTRLTGPIPSETAPAARKEGTP